MNTIYFSSGSWAILKAINGLGLKKDDQILKPDYYCEDINNTLAKNFNLNSYTVYKNLKPKISDLNKLISKKTKLIILVQYFNEKIDLSNIINFIQKQNIKVLIDSIHLFPALNNRLYSKADAEVYSIKKSLYLNNGCIAYVNGSLIETKITLNFLNLGSNTISFLKILRSILNLMNLPIIDFQYKINFESNKKNIFSSKMPNNVSADLISIIFCSIIRRFKITQYINLLSLKKLKIPRKLKDLNYLTFGELLINHKHIRINKNQTFKWPEPIGELRIDEWTKNSEELYSNNNLFSLYFIRI
jgi:hypothetical protein